MYTHETLILTREGYQTIRDLSGAVADVWTGAAWEPVRIVHSGTATQETYMRLSMTIKKFFGPAVGHFAYWMTLDLPHDTELLLEDGVRRARVSELRVDDVLATWADVRGITYTPRIRADTVVATYEEPAELYRVEPPVAVVCNQVLVEPAGSTQSKLP